MGLKIPPALFIFFLIIIFKIGELVPLYVNKLIQYEGKNRICAEWGEEVFLSSDLYRLEVLETSAKVGI